MADKGNTGAAGDQASAERKRIVSEIAFPYSDLESAVELAQTIYSKAGSSSDVEELAVWMGQTATGGTFRTRLGAARMFGLVDTSQGRATLTQIGRDVLDNSGKERPTRVLAFLNVELFRALYEQNKGNVLPPPPAIERQIGQLGVSPKQKERARQTFMKSAQYAGFIDSTSGRFVKPGFASGEERPPIRKPGNDGGGPDDPLILAIIQKLPKVGPWNVDERISWLKLLTMAFQTTYGQEAEIEIIKKGISVSN